MSQALTDYETSHEEFAKIIDEKNRYENIKNVKSNDDASDRVTSV